MAEEKKPLFKVTIDNITVEVEPGTSILMAARRIGGDVTPPAMCFYSKLEGSGGKCRTCLVEVSKGSEKDPRPMPKLVASCRTTVMDGMEVKNITSEKVMDARAGVVEFLLINHPLDCPICDQAGECHLQDLSYDHGKEGTRYEFRRRTFEKEDIGPYIQLHMTRCILCYRCTYVADQLTNTRVHGILDRGDHAEISTYISKAIDNDFSGNMIDVCPVGALTDKTFRFKNRVWFTKPGWICNTCRYDKKKLSDWVIEGPTKIARHSVISANHYIGATRPQETIAEVMGGREPKLLMDIHNISDVNDPNVDLSQVKGAPTSSTYENTKKLS
jgi:NADH-quinone oxidoreductase subunit G